MVQNRVNCLSTVLDNGVFPSWLLPSQEQFVLMIAQHGLLGDGLLELSI